MKIRLAILILAVLSTTRLSANDDFEFTSYQSVLQTLDNQEQEISDVATRLTALETQVPACNPPAAKAPPASNCNPGCDPCVTSGGWTAGAGVYYLQPRWGSNPALTTFSPAGTTSVTQNFDYRGHVAPLVYVGYTGKQRLGIRAQWFNFRSGNTVAATQDGVANGYVTSPVVGFQSVGTGLVGDTIFTQSSLAITAIDLEATKTMTLGRGSYLLSGGVRYAHVGQEYDALLNSGGAITAAMLSGHNFNGAGPTLAATARYPFPFARGVGIYGRARGAMLIGQQHDINLSNLGGVANSTSQPSNQIMPMSEMEIGVDYNRRIQTYHVFLQTGFVVQSWFGAGNSANTTLTNSAGDMSYSSRDNSNLGLYGVRATAGVTF